VKKIDKLVLIAFTGPFLLTFVVIVFILLTRHMLVLFDDIIGKGLEFYVVVQLLFQFAIFMTPMAIPLSILLSSLMTMGNLGEHFELTAIKSAGISLNRSMLSIFVVVCFLTGIAFCANNYLVPEAALRAYSLLYDIRQKKPAMDLKEGVFYDGIPGFNIKIGKKHTDGSTIEDIIIYDHRSMEANGKVTLADSGIMSTVLGERYLRLELFNGYFYNDTGLNYENQGNKKGKLSRSRFGKSVYILDLSSFQLGKTDPNDFAGIGKMMDLAQLTTYIDSTTTRLTVMEQHMRERAREDAAQLVFRDELNEQQDAATEEFVKYLYSQPATQKTVRSVVAQVRAAGARLQKMNDRLRQMKRKKAEFEIHYHKIWANSAACLIMFLIGAPLGAIVKKGGLGMPVLVSVGFFIIFYVIGMQGEKYAKQGLLDPALAMWMANLVLLPAGLFFLRQARADSRLFDPDIYPALAYKIRRRFKVSDKLK